MDFPMNICDNLSYFINYDYDKCYDDDEIRNFKITEVYYSRLFKELSEKYNHIEKYCLDRILTYNGIHDFSNFSYRIFRGYYGPEVGAIDFNAGIECQENIDVMLSYDNDKDKIEYVLNIEYGFILDCIKNKNWEVRKIDKKQIIFGNQDYTRRLNKNTLARYKDHPLPKGICLQDGERYRLIDGYHRCISCNKEKFEVLCAY